MDLLNFSSKNFSERRQAEKFFFSFGMEDRSSFYLCGSGDLLPGSRFFIPAGAEDP
jgi:hypothetical protein